MYNICWGSRAVKGGGFKFLCYGFVGSNPTPSTQRSSIGRASDCRGKIVVIRRSLVRFRPLRLFGSYS